MTNLDIKVNIGRLLNYSESLSRTMKKKTLLLLIEDFSYYVSRVYMRMIREAIYSNRYKGEWEPVSDEGYKKYLGTDPKGDILSLMRESIEVKKIGYNFLIRFNPSVKYPKSNFPLARVIRSIDSGTTKFHARPIFSKIIKYIEYHLVDLWRGYLLMRGVI